MPSPISSILLRLTWLKKLKFSKLASDINDVEGFEAQRNVVLDCLEPHYLRILSLSDLSTSYVKEQKRHSGILGTAPLRYIRAGDVHAVFRKDIVDATRMLEAYVATFSRDLSPDVRVLVRLYQHKFHAWNKDLERDQALTRMSKALRNEDWMQWYHRARKAAADMEKQYIEICKACREIFDGDMSSADPGCELDIEAWRFDEQIKGGVDEPDMGTESP